MFYVLLEFLLWNDSIITSVFLVISTIQLHHKLLNKINYYWATYTEENKTCLVNFSYKWQQKICYCLKSDTTQLRHSLYARKNGTVCADSRVKRHIS